MTLLIGTLMKMRNKKFTFPPKKETFCLRVATMVGRLRKIFFCSEDLKWEFPFLFRIFLLFFELALRISQTSIPRNYQSKKKFLRKPCGEIFFSTPKRKKFTKKITAKWFQCSYNLASKISGRSIQPSKSQIRLDLRFLFFWNCFCDWIENFNDTFDIINLLIQWRQRKSEEDLHRLKFKNIRKRNGRCEKRSKFNYEKLDASRYTP